MTTYQETTDYLFGLHRIGIKLGLENTETLLAAAGNPQLRWPAIHLAGTNGKGSTSAIVAAILRAAGYKVGLYTSPHLIDFTERMLVNGVPIDRQSVIDFVRRFRPLVEELAASFFEVTTVMAFWYFAREGVDVAVVETGMGGRLDSTNTVSPLICGITPIGLDHQEYLGDTLEKIAAEKGGIIKKGVPVLTNNREPAVLGILDEICQKKYSPLWKCDEYGECHARDEQINGNRIDLQFQNFIGQNLWLNLAGNHQLENALLAVGLIRGIAEFFPVSDEAVAGGLAGVQWRGRLDVVRREPAIIIDVGHNFQGIEKTLAFMKRFFPDGDFNIAAFLQADKDIEGIGRLMAGSCREVYEIDLKKGKFPEAGRLANAVRNSGGKARLVADFETFWNGIWQAPEAGKAWLIAGSHYLAGEAYRLIQLS
ncbi:MAG: bifunctional folylpolyglutamate synthase/dihydrofolate synthase [Calditrichaeota bacterium]|nr:bifunctional folylpolyglutamate synthase/dihydrofolate synthase [Calditrichota bacterium]